MLQGIRDSFKRKKTEEALIGSARIRLPPGSMLNDYRSRYKRYDRSLGDIANVIYQKYQGFSAIDIGANVGDTAALIRQKHKIPVLCIEGDRNVVEILRANLPELGDGITIEASFVGPKGTFIEPDRIDDAGKNASLVGAFSESGVALRPMDEILQMHPDFSNAKLLKTDCEGFDFEILESAYPFISTSRPVIFLEYAPTFRPEAPDLGPKLFKELLNLEYTKFLFYDNFGCLLTSVGADEWARFEELHAYLLANKANGTAIYYYDVCAFHRDDVDLAEQVRAMELQLASPGANGSLRN